MSDDDLVKRLRAWDHCWPADWLEGAVAEAADAIERLSRERDEATVLAEKMRTQNSKLAIENIRLAGEER